MGADKITITREHYNILRRLDPERKAAVLGGVIGLIFDGAEPDFSMFRNQFALEADFKRLLNSIKTNADRLPEIDVLIEDFDFLFSPGALTADVRDAFIQDYITYKRPFPISEADDIINAMLYEDFLQTPYWKSIAYYIKERDHNQCVLCGSKSWLLVHHTSYLHHGDELHHLEDLTTVCKQCHDILHDRA